MLYGRHFSYDRLYKDGIKMGAGAACREWRDSFHFSLRMQSILAQEIPPAAQPTEKGNDFATVHSHCHEEKDSDHGNHNRTGRSGVAFDGKESCKVLKIADTTHCSSSRAGLEKVCA